MDSENWIHIVRASNGFILTMPVDDEEAVNNKVVIAESEDDELSSGQELLWNIMDYFGLCGSRHDAQRLTITREKGDKYEG